MTMKSTGIVRQIDELGRIVLPKELRNILEIKIKDRLEIFLDGDRIIIEKYEQSCAICGHSERLKVFHGKQLCENCINVIKDM